MADYNGATFSVTDCNASTPGQLLKMDGFKVKTYSFTVRDLICNL